jgi:hypothetical protein
MTDHTKELGKKYKSPNGTLTCTGVVEHPSIILTNDETGQKSVMAIGSLSHTSLIACGDDPIASVGRREAIRRRIRKIEAEMEEVGEKLTQSLWKSIELGYRPVVNEGTLSLLCEELNRLRKELEAGQ